MIVLVLICALNLVWWGIASFLCRCDMDEAWMCYHLSNDLKHLKRVEGFEKRLTRINRWLIGWLAATAVSVLVYNFY